MNIEDRTELTDLKHRYFRTLDLKEFDELGTLLTQDCKAAYDNGNLSYEGREAIVEFLKSSLAHGGIISEHHGHHPEFTELEDGSVRGVWYLEDRVIIPDADLEIAGTAFYEDRYVKTDEGWRIAETGYQRVF